MLYHESSEYARLFLYEYQRRFSGSAYDKYPDGYCQVAKFVLKHGNIPLGAGDMLRTAYSYSGYVRPNNGWEESITKTIRREASFHRIKLRDIAKITLEATLLRWESSLWGRHKQLYKAVDRVIPPYL